VPNQVLTEGDYAVVVDTTKSRADRIAAFRRRVDWVDLGLGDKPYLQQIVDMLGRYGTMGLVEARKGVNGDPDIPSTIYVADGKPPPTAVAAIFGGAEPPVQVAFTEQLGNFPFGTRP